ncbi:MAG: hypothetical protein PHG64_00935 [Paludibacter sp.]|nr:hypothetical protein [Paludibacter sp.]
MNYILQLSGFFQRVSKDSRLNPTHVSLYMAIFQFWNAGHFRNPVTISRQELMKISKISAKATYHKCIKDLHNFGYIQYFPSFNPFKGSLVYLFDFQTSTSTTTSSKNESYHTNIETSIEQALVPYLNNINNLNKNIENDTSSKNEVVVKVTKHKAEVIEVDGKPVDKKTKETETRGAEISTRDERTRDEYNRDERFPNRSNKEEIPPDLKDIETYFLQQKSTTTEAEKFYNYFQSNGWKVGGKAPMKDWKASARNWLINAQNFKKNTNSNQPPQPPVVKSGIQKNYSEPL